MTFRLLAVLALALMAGRAAAAGLGPWAGDRRGEVRLVAGGAHGEVLRAGLEIRLAPGWKTYWKAPGDSGIPPSFDWSASRNVAAVAVRWPVPQRFAGKDDTTIGYAGDVILPLRVTAKDPGQPVTLALALRYAVCNNICVPARASLSLPLAANDAADAYTLARLEGFRARVPQPATLGENGALAVRAATVQGTGASWALDVAVAVPAGAEEATLFAAAPNGNAGVPRQTAPGHWRVPLLDPPPRKVELVLASGDRAIAVPVALDGAAATP